jgi:hypothetical protein
LGDNHSTYIFLSQWQNVVAINLKCILLTVALNKYDVLWIYAQELHLHGNSIGDEGIRSLMTGLTLHRGKFVLLFSYIVHVIYNNFTLIFYK